MCCVTLQRRALNELLYISRPPFLIPIFRAPTTTSTTIRPTTTTIDTTTTSTYKILSTISIQKRLKGDFISTTLPSNMISQRIFENLVLTNTIVAAFCIVLMVTITGFLIFLLIPSIRRRWLNNDKPNNERKFDDLPTLSRQPSFHHFTLGPSRFNPMFEPTTGTTTTTTQFGTLFQPHTTTATLLHPTIWTSMSPTSLVSTPIPTQQQQQQQLQQQHIVSTPPSSLKVKQPSPTSTTSSAAAARPPLPSHPPTTMQRSPRKR
ncbi:unnamed protein product [Adineta steineri]|uniref:Uncharacterized protein n=2 Tax=Adineta steineri TaxID=433720 RepID=A0A815C8I4_9BILA|nr:unnamed protein product [Adineta steineri]